MRAKHGLSQKSVSCQDPDCLNSTFVRMTRTDRRSEQGGRLARERGARQLSRGRLLGADVYSGTKGWRRERRYPSCIPAAREPTVAAL
jgi:hypothetical protein